MGYTDFRLTHSNNFRNTKELKHPSLTLGVLGRSSTTLLSLIGWFIPPSPSLFLLESQSNEFKSNDKRETQKNYKCKNYGDAKPSQWRIKGLQRDAKGEITTKKCTQSLQIDCKDAKQPKLSVKRRKTTTRTCKIITKRCEITTRTQNDHKDSQKKKQIQRNAHQTCDDHKECESRKWDKPIMKIIICCCPGMMCAFPNFWFAYSKISSSSLWKQSAVFTSYNSLTVDRLASLLHKIKASGQTGNAKPRLNANNQYVWKISH